ncbi:RHS repeat-associated core domain-containing protein, partial [Leptospira biflexa]
GNGNVLAGGERGGKSHITYKPYGEILRTDSYGPDITKYKYTGQEEDKESGMYYYKARYYDATLGRFVSNDGMVFPEKEQGMNRMMYVEGNPLKWVDQKGNQISNSLIGALIGYTLAPEGSKTEGALLGYLAGNRRDKARNRFYNNDLDRGLGLKNTFGSLQHSDIGRFINKNRTGFYLAGAAVGGVACALSVVCAGAVGAAASWTSGAVSSGAWYSPFVGGGIGAVGGYIAGGLGTSSYNQINWNDRSARAGAFLGGAIGFSIGSAFAQKLIMETFTSAFNFGSSMLGSSLVLTVPEFGQLITVGSIVIGALSYDLETVNLSLIGGVFIPGTLQISAVPVGLAYLLYKGIRRTYHSLL